MQSAKTRISKLLPYKMHSLAQKPNQKLSYVSMALFKF